MPDESAAIFFHALKYSRSITHLKLVDIKCSVEGFKQLGYFLQQNRSLKELWIEDAEKLGASVWFHFLLPFYWRALFDERLFIIHTKKTEDKIDQCDNLARIFNGVSENISLTKLTIKLGGTDSFVWFFVFRVSQNPPIEASIHAALDEVVFTDRSEELCNALETALSRNRSLVELHLINLRFADRLIDSIGKGLKVNRSLKSLNLQGNLIVHFLRRLVLCWTLLTGLERAGFTVRKFGWQYYIGNIGHNEKPDCENSWPSCHQRIVHAWSAAIHKRYISVYEKVGTEEHFCNQWMDIWPLGISW